MEKKEINPFLDMIDETGTKNTDTVDFAENKFKNLKNKKNITTKKDAKFLLRINGRFYSEIGMFAKIRKSSINTIVEEALLSYFSNKDNINDYKKAKEIVDKI